MALKRTTRPAVFVGRSSRAIADAGVPDAEARMIWHRGRGSLITTGAHALLRL